MTIKIGAIMRYVGSDHKFMTGYKVKVVRAIIGDDGHKGLDTEEIVQLDVIDSAVQFSSFDRATPAYAHVSGSTIRKVAANAGAIYMLNSANTLAVIADSATTIRTSTNPLNDGVP